MESIDKTGHVNSDEIIFELKTCVICKKSFTRMIKDEKKSETCPLEECHIKYLEKLAAKKLYDDAKDTPGFKTKSRSRNKKYYDEHKDQLWFKAKRKAYAKTSYDKVKDMPAFKKKQRIAYEKRCDKIKDTVTHKTKIKNQYGEIKNMMDANIVQPIPIFLSKIKKSQKKTKGKRKVNVETVQKKTDEKVARRKRKSEIAQDKAQKKVAQRKRWFEIENNLEVTDTKNCKVCDKEFTYKFKENVRPRQTCSRKCSKKYAKIFYNDPQKLALRTISYDDPVYLALRHIREYRYSQVPKNKERIKQYCQENKARRYDISKKRLSDPEVRKHRARMIIDPEYNKKVKLDRIRAKEERLF